MATTKIISDVSVDGAVKIVPLNGSKALASSSDGTVVESSTTATELGYVHGVTSGIQEQIDTVAQSAAQGLKFVDLNTYQGGTDGEIVKHKGRDGQYVNGYDYKCFVTSGASATASYYRNKTFNEISLQSVDVPHIYRWYYRGYIEGNQILITPNRLPQAGDIAFKKDSDISSQSQISRIVDDNTFIYVNGIEAVFVSDYVPLAAYRNEDGLVGFLCYDDQDNPCLYLPDSTTYNFVDVDIQSGTSEIVSWQQWNSQPSSESAVSDLETRMSAAETAISGKQDVLTFDNAPTADSGNVVKSGGVDTAIKNSQRVFYAVTETAGATAVKEFTIANFPTEIIDGVKTPLKGTILIAQCANADARTAQLKFKVNDGGEFTIRYGANISSATSVDVALFGDANVRYVYAFDGTNWCWVSKGYDANTTYTAGTGLKLSSNQFSLNVPRVTKSANSLPGVNSAIIEEYNSGSNYNLPTTHFYHIITMEGSDSNYATQLALCMTANAAFYRYFGSGTWHSWKRLDNPTVDATPTASSTNPVQSGGTKTYVDEQVATKSSITIRQWVTE